MNKKNLLVDLGIFAVFLAASEPGFTGMALHEWIGVALAGSLVLHLLLHWNWMITVGRRTLGKLIQSSRIRFILNVLLFVAFTAVGLSGLMISKSILPSLGITLAHGGAWKMVHSASANAVLGLVSLHLALHWRWLATMLRRYLLPARLFGFKSSQPVALPSAQGK